MEKLTSNLPMSLRRGTKRRRLIVLVTVAVIGLLAEAALALSMVTFGMGGKFVIEDGVAVLIGEGRRELTGEPMSVVLRDEPFPVLYEKLRRRLDVGQALEAVALVPQALTTLRTSRVCDAQERGGFYAGAGEGMPPRASSYARKG